MRTDFSYDPAAILEEADAQGETARIFVDIRQTMRIPIVTSIWRALAGMEDGLRQTWSAVKSLFETGEPERGLRRVIGQVDLPAPPSPTRAQLSGAGIGAADCADIRNILAAYNRSNGMNFIALTALMSSPNAPMRVGATYEPLDWPQLRPLLPRNEIDDDVWELVRTSNRLGAPSQNAHVATLWRHLAHWPGFLALAYDAFAPFQATGAIDRVNKSLTVFAAMEGREMPFPRPDDFAPSRQVLDTIRGYVESPTQVARMVGIGHAIERWFR